MNPPPLFHGLDRWDPTALRKCLRQGGFHREPLKSLGLPESWLRSKVPRAALLGHAPDTLPIHTLIRLFTLGDAIDGHLALKVLGDSIHGLLEIGFLETLQGNVRSHYQLCPIGDSWIACDFPGFQRPEGPDHVMGIGPSSQLLASLTPLGIEGRTLELACGIGWLSQELLNSGISVVSSDLNPRALDLGRFTAKLRGIKSPDFRLGDGFSTVAGETFDLIVANPPYVQSPGGSVIYREAQVGDPICARLLRDAPQFLNLDGIAVVLINWTHHGDDDWSDAPLSWVPEQGTRRWLFQTECSSPADYAWKWISNDALFMDEQAACDEIERWLTHYREIGAKRISAGFMILQKCTPGGEWTRSDSRAANKIDSDAGRDLLRVLDNETWLARDPELLTTRFVIPEGLHAEVSMKLASHGWNRETIRLTSPCRLSYDGQIDENLLRLIAIINEGKTPLAMLEEIQGAPQFAAIDDLPQRISELVRELVRHGILVPA